VLKLGGVSGLSVARAQNKETALYQFFPFLENFGKPQFLLFISNPN
jgi:hypothetical protein